MTKFAYRQGRTPSLLGLLCLGAVACGGSNSGGHSGPGGAGGQGGGDTGGAAGGPADPFADCFWDLGSGMTMSGPAPTTNDSADLSGAVLGDIAFTPATMRKAIPVHVAAGLPGMVVGPMAYITRTDPSTEAASLALAVTNGSTTTTLCFIRALPLEWLDAGGLPLNGTTETFDFIRGSVGLTMGGGYTDTCLAPMETGYFLDPEFPFDANPLYTAVASISLSMDSSATGVTTGALKPFQYDVGHCPSADAANPDPVRSMRVWGRNDGTGYVLLASDDSASQGPVVMLDDAGLPATWGFVSRDVPTRVDPGQTTQYVGSVTENFSVARALFFLFFEGPPVTATSAAAADTQALVRRARARQFARWQAVQRLRRP